MIKKTITSEIEVYSDINELSENDKNLVEKAKKASEKAFAPYSNFFVGAAVLLDNDVVVEGNNQENAAFPSGMCAERVALYNAKANFNKAKIKAIAIYAKSNNFILEKPVYPCGACRQVLIDYELTQKDSIRVIMCSEKGEIIIANDIKTLMPLHFSF